MVSLVAIGESNKELAKQNVCIFKTISANSINIYFLGR